ncbi:hypothetical protein [Clostridium sp. UBA6640]|uniref:hypothetical protein n=1 Tax=Clostridium sp. UBA6640 TaxID=1946370 RepID=UPI0025BFC973|nr:hypothetical protein [Clostridium sp. UBA6640]
MSVSEKIFVLQKSITKNIGETALGDFIKKEKMTTEYAKMGKGREEFISDMVNQGKIKRENLNEFLYKELFYGKQKANYIRKFSSCVTNLESETEVIDAVCKTYNVRSGDVNYIAMNFFIHGESIEALPLFKILKDKTTGKVKKIHFIFSERVGRYTIKGAPPTYEHSFIPVEIDVEKKIMVIRVARKDKMVDDNQKYDMLQDKYSKKVIELLGLCVEIFVHHKENLYKMMTYLVDQIFTEMCKSKPKEIGPIIKKLSADLLKKLNIDNWDKKKSKKNIFDLEQNIDRLIDHMLITDILYDRNIKDKLEGVDGIITYLKFSDGINLQAILSGENYTRAIYDSDAFMGLRRTIDNVKAVMEANVIWYNGTQIIRVKYDMSSPQYMFVFFYRYYNQGEFEYALGKYEEIESGDTDKVQKLDKGCAN